MAFDPGGHDLFFQTTGSTKLTLPRTGTLLTNGDDVVFDSVSATSVEAASITADQLGADTVTAGLTLNALGVAFTGSEDVNGSGALGDVSTTTTVTAVTTTGAASGTLPAASDIRLKIITMIVDAGDYVLTPSALQGGTTITFNDAGDSVILIYVAAKWRILANFGCTVA